MAKKKVIRRGKPLYIYDLGGSLQAPSFQGFNVQGAKPSDALGDNLSAMAGKTGGAGSNLGGLSGAMGQMGQIGSSVGNIIQAGVSNAQLADTSGIEQQNDLQKNMVVGASNNDDLMSEWGSWSKLKDNYSWKDVRGGSNGQRAMNTIGSTVSGASTGMSIGGPVGGIIGGVVGLGSALAGWFTGNRKAKKKAKKLNAAAAEANDRALSSFEMRADNIDKQNDFGLMANYAAYGGFLPMYGGQAVNYELANKDLNNKQLNAMGKLRLTSLPNSFGPEFQEFNTFAEGGGLSRDKNYGSSKKPYPSVPSGDFAGPHRSYPIPTKADARDALRLAGLHGNSSVRAKVLAKYPSLKALGGDLGLPNLLTLDAMNTYAEGGDIHIKKANRGKFTEYCGGKVTSACIAKGKRSSSPAVRKRATFAQNARKWHAYGGYLDDVYNEAPYGQTLYNDAYDSYSTYPDSFTHGGVFGDGVNLVGEGGSHEDNPIGGVPMGVAPDGQPNLVEEGEVVFNDYVFSNRLHADGGLLERYNLPSKFKDHTFASIAEKINKEPSERPNDPIAKRGLASDMSRLMQAQEDIKTKKEAKEGNQFAEGGYKPYKNYSPIGDDWYTKDYMGFVENLMPNDPFTQGWVNRINNEEFGPVGGNQFDVPNVKRLATDRKKGPVHNAMFSAMKDAKSAYAPSLQSPQFEYDQELPVAPSPNPIIPSSSSGPITPEQVEEQRGIRGLGLGLEDLRYAPAVGAGISSLTDLLGLTNRPDMSEADMILQAASGLPTIEAEPIGNYLSYSPFDRDFYINKLNANSASTRRALQNTSGGNRLQAQAGILASDYNYGQNLGDLARKAEEYNLEQRERVEGFNRGTNQFNSEARMRAAMANQSNREMQLRGVTEAARMRGDAKARSAAARSANLSNFFDSIGDIGREEFSRNMIESNPAYGYSIDRKGNVSYKGKKKDNKKKKGGYLNGW